MYASNVLAVSGALVAAVAAVPMAGQHQHHQHLHGREIVWETAIDEIIVTIPVTKTVWIEPGETPYEAPSSTPEVAPAAYTPSSSAAPAPVYTPESSSSVYVAPAYTPESSSSVYVAPAYTPESSSSVYVAPTPESTYVAPTTSVYVAPTPESTYVAPTTSVYVAPTPESTYVAPTTPAYVAPSSTYVAPVESSAPSSGGDSGAITYGMAKSGTSFTGDLTYYEPGLGACGFTNTTADTIVAISEAIFDSYDTGNPNNNPLCRKWLTITGPDGAKHAAQIVDRCPGCATADLDLTEPFFNKVTITGNGRMHGITWTMD